MYIQTIISVLYVVLNYIQIENDTYLVTWTNKWMDHFYKYIKITIKNLCLDPYIPNVSIFPFKNSELRFIETMEIICDRVMEYNIHAERKDSRR